jgi:hypothetical protein
MPQTLKQAAETVILVQNGCNLSGILQSFTEVVMETLWPAAREQGKGTDWVNQHPICTLFLDKLASLNRSQCLCSDNMQSFSKAYDAVVKMAAGEKTGEPAEAKYA